MFYVIFIVLGLLLVGWPMLKMLRAANVKVPEGFYGHDGENFYPPGTYPVPYQLTMIDMRTRVSAPFSANMAGPGEPPKVRRCLMTWRPDAENLETYLKHPDIDKELQRFYSAYPDLDLPHYARILGIEIVRVEEATKKKTSGVSLGDDVEIPY